VGSEGGGARLHHEAFVFDLHTHGSRFLPQPFRSVWRAAVGAPPEDAFDALRAGGVDAAVTTAVGDPIVTRCYLGRSPWDAVEVQLARIERQVAAAGAVVASSVAAVMEARSGRTPAVLLGIEGADALGHDVDLVDAWHQRGVRLVGLVHLGDNSLGTTCLAWQRYAGPLPVRGRTRPGLTALGRRVVTRMNRLGMVVDLAHGDRATVLDTSETTTAPVVSSHTGARALQDFPRYLTDEELRAIAATGGLIGLWPYRNRGQGVADLAELVAHARHVADLVGPEHLAVGTDMNGLPGAMVGFGGESDLPRLTSALLDAGFARCEVSGIMGGNALRVLTLVEEHASASPG
jgi:microsomal dipeptidase-like Zn-dependent dipeptidase